MEHAIGEGKTCAVEFVVRDKFESWL